MKPSVLRSLFAKLVGTPARSIDYRDHVRQVEKLAAARPGGSRTNPIDVSSPAVIEIRAQNQPCPQCAGHLRLQGPHAAPAPGLRRADVKCDQCSTKRSIWFRLLSNDN